MLKHEAAAYLAGLTSEDSSNTVDPTNVHVISGEVSGESEDGKVLVSIDGMMFSEGDDQYIEVESLGGLEDGDIVTIMLTGESGHGMAPFALGTAGTVDRVKATAVNAANNAQAAQETADAAQAVAEATDQHFFSDENGIHVTEETQEDWNTNHTGANVLINSIGQLFRDGLNNLLTLTTENNSKALAIWDGLGNTAEHIRAIIGETITLGNASENHLELDGDSLEFLDQDDNRLFYIAPYDGDGIPDDSFVRLSTDSGWFEIDGGGHANLEVASDDVTINVKEGNATAGALYACGSEVRVYQPFYADEGATASYQLSAEGTLNTIALRANTAGNRGLYDVTGDEWILYCHYSTNKLVLNKQLANLAYEESSCAVNTTNVSASGDNRCFSNGAAVSFAYTFSVKSALASGSTLAVGTLPSGYRPPCNFAAEVYTSNAANVLAVVSTAGGITIRNVGSSSLATTTTIRVSGTFIS